MVHKDKKEQQLLSLKLAELGVIYEEIGERPILLLDDFMSELDEKRIQGFFNKHKENQVIITCTDRNLK
jgi:DNA replication and repair protein RecF